MHPLLKIAYLFFSILFVSSPLVLAQVQSNEEREAKTAYIEGLEAFVNEEYDRATTYCLKPTGFETAIRNLFRIS